MEKNEWPCLKTSNFLSFWGIGSAGVSIRSTVKIMMALSMVSSKKKNNCKRCHLFGWRCTFTCWLLFEKGLFYKWVVKSGDYNVMVDWWRKIMLHPSIKIKACRHLTCVASFIGPFWLLVAFCFYNYPVIITKSQFCLINHQSESLNAFFID